LQLALCAGRENLKSPAACRFYSPLRLIAVTEAVIEDVLEADQAVGLIRELTAA
jgi:hypothetical protein